jgi:hypothetical protein
MVSGCAQKPALTKLVKMGIPPKSVPITMKPSLVDRAGEKQVALITELGQPGVFAAIVFLGRQAVSKQIFRGAVAATVVNQQLHASRIGAVEQLTQIKLGAYAYLLRIAGAALDPAMQVGNRFGTVVTGQFDALVGQLLAFTAPVASECRAVHQIVGQCRGWGEKA